MSDFRKRACAASAGLLLLLQLWSCVEPGTLDHKKEFQSLLKKQAAAAARDNDGGEDDGGASPSPAADAGKPGGACPEMCTFLAQHCGIAGCHTGSAPAGELDLKATGVAMRLTGMKAHTSACSGRSLIDATTPDKSLLYTKLTNPPACGARMPIGAPLSDDEIACVREFVAKPSCSGGK